MKTGVKGDLSDKKKGGGCRLCGNDRVQFEATILYCNGSCGMQRIRRNAIYYTDQSKLNHWCAPCYTNLTESDPILLDDGNYIKKDALQKFKNDALSEEAWVQCDDCSGWVHQICALFNGRKNRNAATYACPSCYLEKVRSSTPDMNERSVPLVRTAKDLQTCSLSVALETELNKTLEKEYAKVAKDLGCNVNVVEKASTLYVRVVSNIKKKHVVRDKIYNRYKAQGCPCEYPVTSKLILLFQTIHGVDVLIFGMYVYEYGYDCPEPNRRRVYISYLDSVQYFKPKRYRTHAYHSILIGYFRYVKAKGFHSAHIWSCPPSKGDDYVFYCRPAQQRTPNDEMLCAWYHKMLSLAKKEGVVMSTATLYDEFFDNQEYPGKGLLSVPYFEGDYIPGEIENIISELKKEGPDTKENKTQKKLKGAGQDLVMHKLGQSLKKMKQNFLVVHFHKNNFMGAVEKDDTMNQPEKSNRQKCTDKGVKSPLAVTCNGSTDLDLSDTKENNLVRETESFDTRQQFLNFCQGNHFQFDQLRRAKHTTMMILYHLHNPTVPKVMQQCGSCYREITCGIRYHCENCSNFDLCQDCYKPVVNGIWAKRDSRFAHDNNHTFKAIDMETGGGSQFNKEERTPNINEHLKLLIHATNCDSKSHCKVNGCIRMKQLIRHLENCPITHKNTCTICTRVLFLLSLHAKQCTTRGPCNILFCDRIRDRQKRIRQRQQLIDDRRREAQNELHRNAVTT